MQKYCTELTERLLKSLDKEYNVVDMGAVVEVITALEKTTITKEVLEITRLGKYINELRRKTSNDALAKRAKDLVRRWRDMVLPSAHTTPQPTLADTAPVALNGAKPQSPALRSLKPQSPALRGLKPQSPLVKDTTPLRVLSPVISVHSDHSRSPHITPNKPMINVTTNHRPNLDESPKIGPAIQNHVTDAVPRTHSSNKRLRKEDSENSHTTRTPAEPFMKRQRLNGENFNSSLNSQVPSPLSKERIPEKSVEPIVESEVPVGPKKRGRKKGSKSVKKQQLVEDHVKEKLASMSRNPKLKTTQELLADLQARGSHSNSIVTSSQSRKDPPSTEDVLRSNSEHVTKYLQSQNDVLRGAGDGALQTRLKSDDSDHKVSRYRDIGGGDANLNLKSRESPSRTPKHLTVEEILAKLPPLDLNAIVWSDPEDEQDDSEIIACPKREISAEDLDILHTQQVEGLNGNFQPKLTLNVENGKNEVSNMDVMERVASDLSTSKMQDTPSDGTYGSTNVQNSDNRVSQKDREFREWHEMLARPSYNDQILHILPYVIID
ncbi:mediator of RNA polymerase II transcription subunit 26 [Neodiprion pinetum]|uniref:Mediator of RNA polymerase II transcription subunit 26 n=1 Tax=Neodiprion lecontei TaxID=441921 RepID=A0A6J0C9C3_NEOLC|nr:mediator of RNA polymerase II transcription subunit 26 [Neodiprion lecontei]XP_046464903.1 mediator of RNA polymerase II transcription subunit 26 [Neodiprion pinetum]